jgi:two-component system CheB/CheR fusion protein
VTNLNYVDLENDAKQVLNTLRFTEKEVTTSDERWFKVRIILYRTLENLIDGVVITLIDITKSKQVQGGLGNTQKDLGKNLEDLEIFF